MKESIPGILTFMQTTLAEDLTIGQIALHFGYSKYHFSREFKRLTGFSAADYLSSLKVEYAKHRLLHQQHNVTESALDAGYASMGSFSAIFKQKTGLSPLAYKQQVESLYHLAKQYERNATTAVDKRDSSCISATNHCTLSLHYPEGYQRGITFAGLFRTPIPNHRPVIGAALTRQTTHHFQGIPHGDYYILACSIEKSFNPLRYFVLNDCLRGRVQETICFPASNHATFHIQLREPLPEDPPIVLNLPKLLADALFLPLRKD